MNTGEETPSDPQERSAMSENAFNLPGMESTKAQGMLRPSTPAQAGDSDQIVIHELKGPPTMTVQPSRVPHLAGGARPAASPRWPASIRRWARVGIAAQVIFVASWLAAASWQGPRYTVLAHSISEMYARTAPHAMFLVIVLTLCGAATIWFVLRSVWPALRPGGRAATVGSALLALSIAGLGDLLTAFERVACRMADPGCTTSRMLSNSGGKLDDALSSIGLPLLVLAGFFLAHAMRRIPSWQAWARPARWTAALLLVLLAANIPHSGLGGLFERLAAAAAAAAIAALAVGILRRSRDMGGPEPGRTLTAATIVGGAQREPPRLGEPLKQAGHPGGGSPSRPRPAGWAPARIVSVVIGAVLALGLLGTGGTALWAQTAKGPGGYLDLGTRTYTTGGYAVASGKAELQTATGGWGWASALFGTVRLRATQARGTAPVFVGIAPAAAAAHYLAGVSYSRVTGAPATGPVYAAHSGGPPAVPPGRAGIWAAHAAGPGPQVLTWPVKSGTWTAVAMNANGSRPVSLRVTPAATLPALPWLAFGLLVGGFLVAAVGATLIVVPLRRVSRPSDR
jgi:uncharacterized protein DUF998